MRLDENFPFDSVEVLEWVHESEKVQWELVDDDVKPPAMKASKDERDDGMKAADPDDLDGEPMTLKDGDEIIAELIASQPAPAPCTRRIRKRRET